MCTQPPLPPQLPSSALLVVPVYNHGGTLRQVAERALAVHRHLLVVDDGSTESVAPLLQGLPVTIIRHSTNMGKGLAIRSAANWAAQHEFTHIITLDADGQHNPEDARLFAEGMREQPEAVFIGARDFTVPNVPNASRFGRAFSGFWMRVQTGVVVSDMQSGFRVYPIVLLQNIHCSEDRFAFEIEILVRASWAGFSIREIPISVVYPPRNKRISHFKALRDNISISLLNTRLTMRAMLPLPARRYQVGKGGEISVIRPMQSLRLLLEQESTPSRLALAAALGMGIGTLPIFGLHTIMTLFLAGYFRLNKICALAVSQLGIPPLVPALAIELGHYCLHGRWLTDISWRTLGHEAGQRLWEWVIGSLLLAPILAGALWLAVYFLTRSIQRTIFLSAPGKNHAGKEQTYEE